MGYNEVKIDKHALVKSWFKRQSVEKMQNWVFLFIFVGYVCTSVYGCRVNFLIFVFLKLTIQFHYN